MTTSTSKNTINTPAIYSILVWGPNVSGDELVNFLTISEVIETVRRVEAGPEALTCQIISSSWEGGYVTTWQEGGASAKYFKGHDRYGFGGQVPADAGYLEDVLNNTIEHVDVLNKFTDSAGNRVWSF